MSKNELIVISYQGSFYIDPRLRRIVSSFCKFKFNIRILDIKSKLDHPNTINEQIEINKSNNQNFKIKELIINNISKNYFENQILSKIYHLVVKKYFIFRILTILDTLIFLLSFFLKIKNFKYFYSSSSVNKIRKYLYLKRFNKINFENIEIEINCKNTIFIGCDFKSSLIAMKLANKNNSKFIFDIKELFSEENEDMFVPQKVLTKSLENKMIKNAYLIFCVSKKIREFYLKNNPHFKNKIKYIPNTKNHQSIKFLNIKKKIKFVLVGNFYPQERGIEFFIKVWNLILKKYKPNITLDLYLTNISSNQKKELKLLLDSEFLKTFSVKKPIKLKEFEKVLKNYDIGIIPYLSKSLNYEYSSPNKFGDYVSNGLIVCSSGTSEIKEIIKKKSIGFCYNQNSIHDSASIIYKYINNPKLLKVLKKNTIKFFNKEYNWEIFEKEFINKE